jgi:hypothetical protein
MVGSQVSTRSLTPSSWSRIWTVVIRLVLSGLLAPCGLGLHSECTHQHDFHDSSLFSAFSETPPVAPSLARPVSMGVSAVQFRKLRKFGRRKLAKRRRMEPHSTHPGVHSPHSTTANGNAMMTSPNAVSTTSKQYADTKQHASTIASSIGIVPQHSGSSHISKNTVRKSSHLLSESQDASLILSTNPNDTSSHVLSNPNTLSSNPKLRMKDKSLNY